MGSFWDHLGVILRSFRVQSGIILGSLRGHSGIILDTKTNHFGGTVKKSDLEDFGGIIFVNCPPKMIYFSFQDAAKMMP